MPPLSRKFGKFLAAVSFDADDRFSRQEPHNRPFWDQYLRNDWDFDSLMRGQNVTKQERLFLLGKVMYENGWRHSIGRDSCNAPKVTFYNIYSISI